MDREQAGQDNGNGGFMLSLQCTSCEWIWSESFSCALETAVPRCPECAHEPVLILKLYTM
jgi:NAD-dependent SIR2 family protein deacetylase